MTLSSRTIGATLAVAVILSIAYWMAQQEFSAEGRFEPYPYTED